MFEWIVFLILVIARSCDVQFVPPAITQSFISVDEFRLIGGSSPNEGRLQVKHAGVPDASWSTICSDDVDTTIAFALCARMGHKLACDFGFASEFDTINPNTDFGPIENVNFADCIRARVPYELDCTLVGFTGSTCTHSQDVWLRCASDPSELELRLASPISSFTGTLQARCTGRQEWSSVCSGDFWEIRDAESACRHLGFSFAIETDDIYVSNLDPIDIPDSVIISEVGCLGNETNLMECELGLVSSTCSTLPRISCGTETSEFGSRVGLCGINDLCGTECAQQVQTIGISKRAPRIGCHCDELCQAFGDCCYDYQTNCNPEGLPPPTSLRGFPVGWYQCVEVPSLYGSFVGYYLISVCPESWLDGGIKDLCTMPMSREDIIASLPVYNNDTLHQYRNIYCAICNGESYERMLPWSVHAAYMRGSNSHVPNFNDTELPGSFTGDFTVQVPDTLKGEVRRCSVPAIDTCLDEFSGSQTEQGCQSYVGPLAYRPVIGSTITNYRNPYCAICNNVTLTLRESCDYFLCKVECDVADPWSRCFKLCEGLTNILTLDLLFNFKSDNIAISCSTGEIFDPFLSSCRALTCASGFEIQGNECVERTVPSTSAPVAGQEFAFNPNNTVNVGLVDCLRLFLGENTHGIVYWDATLNESSKVELFTVNFLAGNETVVDNIHSTILSYRSSFCNISQFVLFLELQSILPTQACKNYNATGLDIFHGYVIRSNLFRIRQFDYNFMTAYDIYGIDNACLKINLTCSSFVTLNSTEFVQLTEGNETVLKLTSSGLSIPHDAYVVLADGSAVICADYLTGPVPQTATALALIYLSYIFYSLSVIALAVTFIIYSILPPLRNLAGLAIMNLVGALFVANFLLLLSGQLLDIPTLCLIAAPVTHFTWLAAFMWMAVLSFNVTRTLSSKVVNRTHQSTTKPLLQYTLFAWGVPLVIVAICIALHFCQCTSAGPIYADQTRCYIVNSFVNLYAFGIPVALTLSLSICLFVYTVVFLRRSRSSTRMARNETRLQEAKVELAIYFRLSVLMGLSWILGFLIQIIDGYAIIFIFVILNSLQGVFIFLSFCFTKRVKSLLLERYGSKKQHQTRRKKTNQLGESAASGTQSQFKTNPSVNTDTTRI